MRTNIVIDQQLMAAAMRASGLSTKKKAVEEGLKLLASQPGTGLHPAYAAWLARKTGFEQAGKLRATRQPRSSDPMKAALDAKYRR